MVISFCTAHAFDSPTIHAEALLSTITCTGLPFAGKGDARAQLLRLHVKTVCASPPVGDSRSDWTRKLLIRLAAMIPLPVPTSSLCSLCSLLFFACSHCWRFTFLSSNRPDRSRRRSDISSRCETASCESLRRAEARNSRAAADELRLEWGRRQAGQRQAAGILQSVSAEPHRTTFGAEGS